MTRRSISWSAASTDPQAVHRHPAWRAELPDQPLYRGITHQKQTSYSGFGQLLFDVSPEVQITAGGATRMKRRTCSTTPWVPTRPGDRRYQQVTYPGHPNPKLTFNNFSPELTVTYKPGQRCHAVRFLQARLQVGRLRCGLHGKRHPQPSGSAGPDHLRRKKWRAAKSA